MSMHQGLDLSRFKKVSSDNKSTTLVHSKGHEIKIAHSGLTPKMREQLNGLPVHLAEGGDVKKEDDDPSAYVEPKKEDTSDPSAAPQEPAPQPQTQLAEAAPAPAPEDPQSAPVAAPMQQATQAQQAPAPVAQPQVQQPDPLAPKTAAQMADEMTAHDMAFQQDLAKGHIKPQTYHDLYEKKDTLGKIGTLFGLLIGGAGSGLTHQPNAVMEMMNKQIQNDFDAQKASQSNAQNWLNLSQQHELQKAQIARYGVENQLTQAQIGKMPAEAALLKAQTSHANADTQLIAQNAALIKMKLAAIQKLTDDVNKMPPGPQKDTATGALNNLSAAVNDDVVKSNAQTASQIEARNKIRGATGNWAQAEKGQISSAPSIDEGRLTTLLQLGQMNEREGLPGGIRSSEAPKIEEQSNLVKTNRSTYQAYVDSYNKLDQAFAAGKLNPGLHSAVVNNFETSLARQVGSEEAKRAVSGMFPDIKDWGSARDQKFSKATEHFKINEAGTNLLDRYKLKSPFPDGTRTKTSNIAKSEPKKHATPKESAPDIKVIGGKKYKRGPNGEAVEVK